MNESMKNALAFPKRIRTAAVAGVLAALVAAGARAGAQTGAPPGSVVTAVVAAPHPVRPGIVQTNLVEVGSTPDYQLFGFAPLSPQGESNEIARATNATLQVSGSTNQVRSLSLMECVTWALTNNFDIKVQRLNPVIDEWGVELAQGEYDPTLAGSIDDSRSKSPVERGVFGLPAVFEEHNTPAQMSLGGKLASGASYSLSSSETRANTTPEIGTNFLYTGTTSLQITQPLLKNFGFGVNTATIQIARKSRDIAVQSFVLQMINSVSAVDNAYYELVYAIENYKAAREDLAAAQSLLDQTKVQLKVGTASSLDLVTSQAGVAERLESIILAARTIKDNENALKVLISQNVREFGNASLIPSDYPEVRPVQTDVAQSINVALRLRPDYLATLQAVEQQNILVKFNHNQLWPEIDLNGSYGYNGGANNLGDTYDSEFAGRYPVWAAGISLTFPLGNRQARATYNESRLLADQLLLKLKQLEQQIVVAVDDAVGHVQTDYEAVIASRAATRLANESYKAELTKLQVGTSTPVLVLQQESNLQDARSAQIRAEANYSEALVALAQAEGTTLQRHHIQFNELY